MTVSFESYPAPSTGKRELACNRGKRPTDAKGRCLCKECGDGTLAVQRGKERYKCLKHLRFAYMRWCASNRGLAVPSREELERLLALSNGMRCADCGKQMVWIREAGVRDAAVSLQHYRDGTFGLVCSSCNTRHQHMPGDTFRQVGPDFKHCARCNTTKPRSEFYPHRAGGSKGRSSNCIKCSREIALAYYRNVRAPREGRKPRKAAS